MRHTAAAALSCGLRVSPAPCKAGHAFCCDCCTSKVAFRAEGKHNSSKPDCWMRCTPEPSDPKTLNPNAMRTGAKLVVLAAEDRLILNPGGLCTLQPESSTTSRSADDSIEQTKSRSAPKAGLVVLAAETAECHRRHRQRPHGRVHHCHVLHALLAEDLSQMYAHQKPPGNSEYCTLIEAEAAVRIASGSPATSTRPPLTTCNDVGR